MADANGRRADLLEALSAVRDPILDLDVVSLNMIRDIAFEGDKVSFRLVLSTPAHPAKDALVQAVREAALGLDGIEQVDSSVEAEVVSDGRSRQSDAPIRNAVAIGSGKGGVGKTTVSVNVAVALAQAGAKVGLLDADVYGPNVPTMMGTERLPEPKENKMLPAEAYGVKVISIAFLVKPGQPLIWRGPMLHSAIRQFITDVDWGELDYLIVDLPPGTGDAALSLAQSLPLSGAVIVTTPQKVALEDASRGLEMFRSMDVPVLGVVENMSFLELEDGSRMDIFGTGGGKAMADTMSAPFLGAIPIDPAVRQAGDSGVPVVISHPDSKAAEALSQAAGQIAARISLYALEFGDEIELEMVD
jgi:ATP-binding protein involved in chromosome partitioning